MISLQLATLLMLLVPLKDMASKVIKRHGQSRGPMAHGSRYHRRPGSMGVAIPIPRVFKGKKLAGRMGNDRVTIQNLEVVMVDVEKNVILIKGNVPGSKKSLIEIKASSQSQTNNIKERRNEKNAKRSLI